MKKCVSAAALFVAGALFLLGVAAIHTLAQGPLTPPGPPAPVMKTLEQIEPRTPITNLPFTISTSGSFYLTTNLYLSTNGTVGILIAADHVVIDLNGFTLDGSGGTEDGIYQPTNHCCAVIRNGQMRNWTALSKHAINLEGEGNVIENLTVRDCANGIFLGERSRVSDCTVTECSSTGILVDDNSRVQRCVVVSNSNYGIWAVDDCHIQNCTVSYNGGIGIRTGSRTIIEDCVISRNKGQAGLSPQWYCYIARNLVVDHSTGIRTTADGGIIWHNLCVGNATGIYLSASADGHRIEDNQIVKCDIGIQVAGTNNLVIGNSVRGSTTPYIIATNNAVGPIVDYTAGGVITNENPWCNFIF